MTGSPRAPARHAPGGGPVTVTGLEQRRAWRAREFPPIEQVTPGVWSVPVTIPDNPLRYTLCYLLLADSGAVVVDPGWDTDRGWDDLQRGFRAADLSPDRVTGIVVTHVHPDHHGLSERLREASGAWIAMHSAEIQYLPSRIGEVIGGPDGFRSWLVRSGVPSDTEIFGDDEDFRHMFSMAEPDRLLDDGDHLDLPGRHVRVVWTPGHTPGHICLHDADYDLLLTGDHLLPRISPNVGLTPISGDSPLTRYLDSLRAMHRYAAAEALPAHEYRFAGLATRVKMLLAHHERRCEEVLAILGRLGPATAWQVTEELTWSRGWSSVVGFMRRAALAEAAAHLKHLVDAGRVTQIASEPVRYQLAG